MVLAPQLPQRAPGRPCSKLFQAFLCITADCFSAALHPDAAALEFDSSSVLQGLPGILSVGARQLKSPELLQIGSQSFCLCLHHLQKDASGTPGSDVLTGP